MRFTTVATRNVVAGLLLAILSFGHGQEELPPSRTITDSDDRAVEVVFVEAKAGFVKLERVADGQPFILELSTLSEADQEWVRRQTREIIERIPKRIEFEDGWRRLTIRLPGCLDEPHPVGMRWTSVVRRLDAFTHEMIIPPGSWVHLGMQTKAGYLEALVPFHGAEEWEVSLEDFVTRIRRDGGPETPVGISLPIENAEAFLARPDIAAISDPVSVELRAHDHHDLLSSASFPIHSFCTNELVKSDAAVQAMSTFRPKALSAYIDYSSLILMDQFQDLEALYLEMKEIPSHYEGQDKRKIAADPFVLPDWPALRDFSILCAAAPQNFVDVVRVKVPKLRAFYFGVTSNSPIFAEWSGIDQIKGLESLHASWGIHLKAGELVKLENLKSLSFRKPVVRSSDPDLMELAKMRDLIQVHTPDSGHPDALWETWAESGALSSTVRVETFQDFPLANLSSVEMLNLRRLKNQAKRTGERISELGKLQQLRYLDLSYATQDQIDAVGALPNGNLIEVIRIANGDFSDLSPLHRLPNLKRLLLIKHHGDSETLDLGKFPTISTFYGQYLDGLTTLTGILDHPALESLTVYGCSDLIDFGDPRPNAQLKLLRVERCYDLPDLNAFEGTTGLEQIQVISCPQLTGPLSLLESNPEGYRYFKDAGEFPEQTIPQP